jgi:GAF domain-containing protein
MSERRRFTEIEVGAIPLATIAESMRTALASRSAGEALGVMAKAAAAQGPWHAASITLLGSGDVPVPAASSDPQAGLADSHQLELSEGPGWDALRSEDLHVAHDVTGDERWPRWSPLAVGLGIAATVAVPLFTDTRLGAMTLYSRDAHAFVSEDIERAQVLGAHVSVVAAHSRMEQNLWRAIDGRNLIGQAQGILMERYQLTAEQAFALLRRYSQAQNVKLAVLAQQLVESGILADVALDGARAARCDPR